MIARIRARLLAILIVLALVLVVIPLVTGSISVLGSVPSWIYLSCCVAGLIIGAILIQTKTAIDVDAVRQAGTNEELLSAFDARLSANPSETKKAYLRLRSKLILRPGIGGGPQSPEALDTIRMIRHLSESLYGSINTDPTLMDEVRRRVFDFERSQQTEGLAAFESRMAQDPNGTAEAYGKLVREWISDPEVAISLSEQIFGSNLLLIHPWSIEQVGAKSIRLRKFNDGIMTARAIAHYKGRLAESPLEVAANRAELLEIIGYIVHGKLEYSGQKTPQFERAFELSKALFGEGVEFRLLEKLAARIDPRTKAP